MTAHEHAVALRARLEASLSTNPEGFTAEETAKIRRKNEESTDEQIINAYVTCNSCGETWLGGAALDSAIATATTAEQFLRAVPHSCRQN